MHVATVAASRAAEEVHTQSHSQNTSTEEKECYWNGVKQHRQSRTIKTVRELWKEYTDGLSGGPALRALEERYKAAWRHDACNRKYWCNRKIIYDEIERMAKRTRPPDYDRAVEELEVRRTRAAHGGASLEWLANAIKKAQFESGERHHKAQRNGE